MPNTLLTSTLITREALFLLELNLGFTLNVNREYDSKYGVEGAKIGYVVNVRKPVKYLGRTGQGAQVEDIQERTTPITLDKQFGVDMEVSTADLSLSIDDFSKRILGPAVSRIAHEIDRDGLKEYVNVYNSVGTPGTALALLTYLSANPKLDDAGAPRDENRWIVVSSLMEVNIISQVSTLFQASSELAKQYIKGRMGTALGFEWVMDQNVQTHTVGAWGSSTPLVNGAGQTGSSLVTDGWESGLSSLNKGDTFTIADVFSVRPHTRDSTGVLQQFVVTADISDTAGAMTIAIDPPITLTGPYQTVSAAPADDAAIVVTGAVSTVSAQGMAYHKDAFALATADLYVPNGVDMGGRAADPKLGISIRFIRDYDPQRDQLITRLDVLYGWATLRPELACRIYDE